MPDMEGAVVHVELSSTDPAATRKFLETVYGWKFTEQPMGAGMQYWTFTAGSGPGGGLMKPTGAQPPGTVVYVGVKSIDAAITKISAAGAKVLLPKTEIPHVGWFALYTIPGGVTQAVFESTPEDHPHPHPH
jgi:predicted enzyme related to lactoylglutathione lyase